MFWFTFLSTACAVVNLQMMREDCLLLISECYGPCWKFVDYYEPEDRCRIRKLDDCNTPFNKTGFCGPCNKGIDDLTQHQSMLSRFLVVTPIVVTTVLVGLFLRDWRAKLHAQARQLSQQLIETSSAA